MNRSTYVRSLRSDMRDALREFRKFDRKWNDLNDGLNVKFDQERLELVQRDKIKSVNITLNGYMNAAKWWRDKAAMLAAIIAAELAAEQLLQEEQ